MTEDINVKLLQPYLFYEALKNDQDLTEWIKELNKIYYQSVSAEEYLKNFGAQLVRNYTELLKGYTEISPANRCIYLNCWTNLEINRHKSEQQINDFYSKVEIFVENVWENLKEKKGEHCNRDKSPFTKEHVNKRKGLLDFCTNRDILRKSKDVYSYEKLNDWVSKMYKKHVHDNYCKTYEDILIIYNENDSPLKIADNCTLYDIHATFPYFGFSKIISFWEHRIRSISNCKKYEKASFDVPPYPEVLDSDDVSSSPILIKITITAFTIVSIFFFGLILYKFSPFGFWLHKNIINKYKIGVDNEEEKNILSKETLYLNFLNSGKSDHHISYHPV
ncbi:PIR Superfamily Protein [Plasmodium ovale wallikeri]|uniref:PIR Superfamily Protein n=1 Tax=Plasmodium ovale wallikeri TaxID=864142 RepID=A0A1A9AQJ5_PLAOA|nr:PIR Superfamily Protein [Plasmodium ovale wallikeri]